MNNRLCKICGTEFKPRIWNQVCCCKKCSSIADKKYILNWRKEHKEEIKTQKINYARKNPNNIRRYNKTYCKNHKEKINIRRRGYERKRAQIDTLYQLISNCRKRINKILISKNYTKKNSTLQNLGCSIGFLKQHLEKQFKSWMTWNNRGLYNGKLEYGWDIDHIIPLSSAKTEEELTKLFHYTNLQPLDSKINRDIKKNKIQYLHSN